MPRENTVTLYNLEKLVDNADTSVAVFWDKEMVVSYQLRDRGGFTVSGRAAVVDPNNFDYNIGLRICREDVIRQLWCLEGYLLQCSLGGVISFNLPE